MQKSILEITQEEYEELGKPSINDTIFIDLSKSNTTRFFRNMWIVERRPV